VLGPGGNDYFGSLSGAVYAVSPAGALLWTFHTGGAVSATPAVGQPLGSDTSVYVASNDGVLYCLSARFGTSRWAAGSFSARAIGDQGAEASFNSRTAMFSSALLWPAGSTVAAAGLVYLGCGDGTLYAFNGASGTVSWRYPTRGIVLASPALDAAASALFFGSADGNVYCLDAAAGALRWAAALGAPVLGSPALAADGGSLALGASDGAVYCLNASSGALLWSYATGSYIYASPILSRDESVIYVGSTAPPALPLRGYGSRFAIEGVWIPL
jgi:outer membrane protein assembly factor BamB